MVSKVISQGRATGLGLGGGGVAVATLACAEAAPLGAPEAAALAAGFAATAVASGFAEVGTEPLADGSAEPQAASSRVTKKRVGWLSITLQPSNEGPCKAIPTRCHALTAPRAPYTRAAIFSAMRSASAITVNIGLTAGLAEKMPVSAM